MSLNQTKALPVSGTQARSRATQARILAAARDLFAREGYDRTTIRAVALAAEADPALVIRYFGGKEGLFAAATPFDLRIPAFDAGDRAGDALIRHFLARWEGDPSDQSLRILLRAGVTNPDAAMRVRAIFAEQVLPVIRNLVPDRPELRAGLLASQLVGLAVARYLLIIPPLAGLPTEAVIACIGPTLQRYLTGDLGTGDLGPGAQP
jgi:AcrR family transcriptional regulator